MRNRIVASALAGVCTAAMAWAPAASAQAAPVGTAPVPKALAQGTPGKTNSGQTDSSPTAPDQATDAHYAIAAQPLGEALHAYARASGREVIAAAELLEGRRSSAVSGWLSADAALTRLLAGTGLRVDLVEGAFVLRSADAGAGGASRDAATPIVVTGTRIRGSAPVGSPVITIDRTAIERSGLGSVQQVLQSLPQAFGGGQNEATLGATTRNGAGSNPAYGSSINLRGLGASSTLVLIDGNRPALGGIGGAFADLSMIPLSAVGQVEVLTDGASAIYGADAVAGVVNLRLRKRFEGAESQLRFASADGDMSEVQLAQLFGKRWEHARLVFAYQYTDRGALAAADRAFAREDLRPFGGPDYRSAYAVPGTIVAADGQTFAIPAGQDGTALSAAALIPGTANRGDLRAASDLLPHQRTHSAWLSGEAELSGSLTLRASVLAARRDYRKAALADRLSPVSVPVTNPFYVDPIGTGQPVTLLYDFRNDLGAPTDRGRVEAITASAGLEQRLGAWRIELDGSYGRQRDRAETINLVNRVRLAAALADPNPASAFNLFGDGSANNPATIAAVRGSIASRTRFETLAAALRADGPLARLPAGDLRLALGAEVRRESAGYATVSDTSSMAPVETPDYGFPAPRTVRSLYAELLVPVFGGAASPPGFHRLDLSLAGRIEDYSDVGRTTNPKLSLRWEPVAGITLRGSYGTSFRAPAFDELIGPSVSLYIPLPLADPAAPGGTSNVLALFGYAPGIRPEKARTWTAGADFSPAAVPGLRASLNFYDIAYRDRIDTVSEDYASFLTQRDVFGGVILDNPAPELVASYYAAPTFANPYGIAASAIVAIVDGRVRNLATVHQRGIDFDLAYAHDLAGGTINFGLAGNHVFGIDRQLTPGAVATEVAGTFANPVKWRLRGELGWSRHGFAATLHANHSAGYRNQIPVVAEHVSAWTTFDLQLAQRFEASEDGSGRSLVLALSALNLFDRAPPYVNNRTNTSALGYDPEQASPLGRQLALQATVRW